MYEKADEFGPEKIIEVHDAKAGLHAVCVIDNTAIGIGKGGIRMVPDITVEEVAGLARAMTWKNAMAGIPFGGTKSGIRADPKKVNKEALMRAFGRAMKNVIPSIYCAGPDMNTTEAEMGFLASEIGDPKACTGKPSSMKGLPHELGSTGFGVAQATRVALAHKGIPINGATVAIEGFGNVGTFTMKFLTEMGAKVIAVSDSAGTAYNRGGFDYGRMMRIKKEKGTVTGYDGCSVNGGPDGCKVMGPTSLFEVECDVLIPGARPNVIREDNVDKIRTKVIVEAANIPMDYEIEKRLAKRGILIIPDFVANAGGVISSYVEYIGGTQAEMFKMVEEKVSGNTKIALEKAQNNDVRAAALEIAKERVISAMRKKGAI